MIFLILSLWSIVFFLIIVVTNLDIISIYNVNERLYSNKHSFKLTNSFISELFILSTALLIIGIEIGYTKFVFKLIDKTPSKLGDIFNYFHLLTKYISGMILYYLILVILFSCTSLYAERMHGISMHGLPKYKSDFNYLDYVNPNAFKGGKVKKFIV